MNKTTRESNIELLRIVAMLMIVAAHFAAHGALKINSSEPYSAFFKAPLFNQATAMLLIPGGKVGVGLFFVITGYFLGRADNKKIYGNISFLRKVLEPVLFYAIFISIISLVLFLTGVYDQGQSFSTLIFSYFSLIFAPFNSQAWWYVTSYIVLLLFVPYTQSLIEKIKDKGFILILSFLIVFELIIPFMLSTTGLPIVRSLFFYFLGAYFYYLFHKNREKLHFSLPIKIVLAVFAVLLWILGAYLNYKIYGFNYFGKDGLKEQLLKLIYNAVTGGVIYPICSGIIFLLFLTMKITGNRIINYIASLTFGIYLMHDNSILRPLLWEKIINTGKYINTDYFILFSVFSIVVVFISCGLIESFRILLLEKLFKKPLDRINQVITNNIFEK